MKKRTLDTATAKRMAEAGAIRGALIVGQPGGWSVLLKLGLQELALGAQRSDKARLWRSLDRCAAYLVEELHIARFELAASHHSDLAIQSGRKPGSTFGANHASSTRP